MSQSQSQGGYKERMSAGYAEARRRAKQAYAHGVTSSLENCANEENILLVLFLQEARDVMEKEGSENIAKAYSRAAKEVRRHPLRIYNKERLLAVNGFGPATSSAVQKHLWSDPECTPGAATSEELEAEKRHYDGVRSSQASQKAAQKQRKEGEKLAKQQAAVAARQLAQAQADANPDYSWDVGMCSSLSVPTRDSGLMHRVNTTAAVVAPNGASGNVPKGTKAGRKKKKAASPLRDPFADEFVGGMAEDEDNEGQPAKKKQRKPRKEAAKKDYIPGVGTANYAFLIALFQAQRAGQSFLTKHDLINNADRLHITNKPITVNANAPVAPGQFAYTSWSCFSQLLHKEPPLAQAYSNPMKCRLTPEGEVLARKLYLDAVERQSIPGDPEILGYIRRMDSGSALPGNSQQPILPSSYQANNGHTNAQFLSSLSTSQPMYRPSFGQSLAGYEHGTAGSSTWSAPARGAASQWQEAPGWEAAAGASLFAASYGAAPRTQQEEAAIRADADDGVILLDSDSEAENAAPPRIPTFASQATAGESQSVRESRALGDSLSSLGASLAERIQQKQQNKSKPAFTNAAQRPPRPAGSVPVSMSQSEAQAPLQALARGSQGAASASLDTLLGENRRHHTQSRLAASWRLQPVVDNGIPEERDIRLPPLQPGERFSDRYQVQMVLDNREKFGSHVVSRLGGSTVAERHTEAAQQLQALGVKVQSRAIEAGDAMWVAQPHNGGPAYSLDTIIERKRVDDLAASIKDQRYERQKYFLARCQIRRTMYLVEGNVDLALQGPMAKACKTAMHRLEVEDGFRVLRTTDSAHTFRLYQRITAALQAKYAPLSQESIEVATSGEPLPTMDQLEGMLRLAKKVTLRDVWALMLCAVPRVSAETCETILERFPTPVSLWEAYEAVMRDAVARGENAVAAGNRMLAKLPRIGPETARSVFQSLFANGWHLS